MGLDEELAKWVKESYFQRDGRPVTLFHGTDVIEDFNIFTRWGEGSLGFHFGTMEVANARLDAIQGGVGMEGVIIPVYCRARRPLRLPDLLMWDQDDMASALQRAGVLDSEEMEHVIDSMSAATIFAAVEEAGYDCVIYANECEHKEALTDSVMVWRAELLKSPFAVSFDPDDPRLLPQGGGSEADFLEWQDFRAELESARRELRALREYAPRVR